ncbi:methionyl-tRNA formyltransferase [bacterium]|nr:methionyl-tRNA formyltransferase [bacterium]
MNTVYNTILMGTPEFSVEMFESLILNPKFKILSLVCQPDKPVGRKQILTPPETKVLAEKYNIPVLQPNKISEIKEDLEKLTIDLIVVIAYGKILPQSILDIPKLGCINVHGSLLPKYRGSSCLQAPILNGDKETGITIMKMDAGMDTGDIIKKLSIDISEKYTVENIHDRLSKLGKENLGKILIDYLEGKIQTEKQDNDKATYVKLLQKEDGYISFSETAENIDRKIRALNPWPGTFAKLDDKNLKILKTTGTINIDQPHEIGELFFLDNKLHIQAKDKALEIDKLQISGKKAVEGKEIISGYKFLEGKILN